MSTIDRFDPSSNNLYHLIPASRILHDPAYDQELKEILVTSLDFLGLKEEDASMLLSWESDSEAMETFYNPLYTVSNISMENFFATILTYRWSANDGNHFQVIGISLENDEEYAYLIPNAMIQTLIHQYQEDWEMED